MRLVAVLILLGLTACAASPNLREGTPVPMGPPPMPPAPTPGY